MYNDIQWEIIITLNSKHIIGLNYEVSSLIIFSLNAHGGKVQATADIITKDKTTTDKDSRMDRPKQRPRPTPDIPTQTDGRSQRPSQHGSLLVEVQHVFREASPLMEGCQSPNLVSILYGGRDPGPEKLTAI